MSGPGADDDVRDNDEFGELIEMVRAQAAEIATLDAARAEAWASDVLALAADAVADAVADPVVELAAALDTSSDALARCAISALVDLGLPPEAPADAPPWLAALGTSRCEEAWLLESGGAHSAAFRFVDVAEGRHVVMIDLVGRDPEQVGEVVVGPGDLLEAVDERDAAIEATPLPAEVLAGRVGAALEATARPAESAVVNGHLLVARLAAITGKTLAPPRTVAEEVPPAPLRDPSDDAYALDVLRRAVGIPSLAEADRAVATAIASMVAPDDLAPFAPVERDAILLLEWADWLGAVLMLVREGAGAVVGGEHLVDLINRCPEVTTTIPARDRPRIAWAFATLTGSWTGLGLVDGGRLTERGARILPAALALAWQR